MERDTSADSAGALKVQKKILALCLVIAQEAWASSITIALRTGSSPNNNRRNQII
jgi:hypothetical protein